MLFRVIILPKAFSSAPASGAGSDLFYSSIICALQDIAENCVVLLDGTVEGGKPKALNSLIAALEQWPEQYKIRAQRILKALETRRRFFFERRPIKTSLSCSDSDCAVSLGVALAQESSPDLILASSACVERGQAVCEGITIGLEEYFISDFARKRRKNRVLMVEDGIMTRAQLESQFLGPVFGCSEVLKLYDRLIGQKVLTRDRAVAGQRVSAVSLPENYRLTLEWIVGAFSRYTCGVSKVVEVYTTADPTFMDRNHILAFERAIENMIQEIHRSSGIRIQVYVKTETEQMRMVHGRYLITERIGFLVERGFDLLWSNEQMQKAGLDPAKDERPIRDVMISACAAERIESTTAKLRDFRVF